MSKYNPISSKTGVQGLFEEKAELVMMGLLSSIPASVLKQSNQPLETSELLIQKASISAGFQSGTLAIPTGAFSLVTILPDLVNIWRIQSQLVADIAAVHGKSEFLGSQEMAWCLFRSSASHVARDFLVKTGQRAILSQSGKKALSALLRRVGIQGAEKLTSRIALRMVPLVGMAVAGGYAFYDTRKVGEAALELFRSPSTLAQ
jgi:hypothetical protein